jgi:octaprenyl-diphosphate synthase
VPRVLGMASGSPSRAVSDFSGVFGLLGPHMAALDVFLRGQLEAFEPEIRSMADYCIDTSGKRIRPTLVFLSGWREDGQSPSEDLVRAAAVVELVHLATLVHDDIMDSAELRRGRRTASREYGPEAAVLLGDALFSHALHLAALFPTTEVCREVSQATRRVCSGEIVQTLRRRTTQVSRMDYFRVIDLKTAELFRVSCLLGSRLSGAPDGFVLAAEGFGRALGIAYQVYDDLADFFGTENRIGKTLGTDLLSGKLTLPLMVLADRLDPSERETLLAEIRGERSPDLARRLAQMTQVGVFGEVSRLLEASLTPGETALRGYPNVPAAAMLGRLSGVLRAQVDALRPV